MKKILSILLVLLLALTLAACTETPAAEEAERTPVETPMPEPAPEEVPEPLDEEAADRGVIVGDVRHLDVEISRLFAEPFVEVLGSPFGQRGAFFYYVGLEIVAGWDYGAEPDAGVAIQVLGFAPDLHMFELNGFSLHMTRGEVLAAFGYPIDDPEDGSLTYHILNPVADYMLTFRFEDGDDDTVLTSISMGRDYVRNIATEPGTAEETDIFSVLPAAVQIADATDALLSGFSRLHAFDYSLVHGAEYGADIIMWADVPMGDFSIITVDREFTDDAVYIFVVDTWAAADAVLPGEAVVINGYHGIGTLSASGFTFVDERGVTRYFTFVRNMGYPYDPGPYAWLIQEFDNTTGRMLALMGV